MCTMICVLRCAHVYACSYTHTHGQLILFSYKMHVNRGVATGIRHF